MPEQLQPQVTEADNRPVAIIGIDYDEWKPETYRAVTVSADEGFIVHRFASGNPLNDMQDAEHFAHKNYPKVFKASSVDNFSSDLRRANADA